MSDVAVLERLTGSGDTAQAEPALDTMLGGDADFQADLVGRLEVVDRDDYDDPARRDLTWYDWLSVVAFVVGISALAFLWGY